ESPVAEKQNESTTPDTTEIAVFVKADVVGALDALIKEITKLSREKIRTRIIGRGVGGITENDVKLASANNQALVVGFNVGITATAKSAAERFGLTLQTFDIIYKLSEWLEEEIKKREPKVQREELVGQGKILKVFGE